MAFPTLGLLDQFNRADENPLAGIWSGPITTGDRQLRIATNLCAPHSVDGFGNSYISTTTYGPDVEAYCTLASAFPAGSRVDFYLRHTPGAVPTGYKVSFRNEAGDFVIYLLKDGVAVGTALDPEPNTMASGDSFGCAMIGNTVEVFWKVGAGAWTSFGTRTDATYTGAGRIGLGLQGGTALRVDNFGGGTIGATAPTAPQSLSTLGGSSQVSLSWSAPASNGGSAVTGYKVYRGVSTGTETLLVSPAGTGTSYIDATAVNGTTYFYKVSAVNAIGESALSNESSATPSVGPTTPSSPQNLQATAGDALVQLSWTAPASDGGSAVTGYYIFRSLTSNTETLLASPAGTATTYTDATAANGTTYFYRVSALNAVGQSVWSNEVTATPSVPQARAFRRFYGPAQLGNTAATLYTCPTAIVAVVRHVHVSNPSGSPVDFTLSIGTSAAATRLWDAIPVPADDVLDHYQDFTLVAGEVIQGLASSAATLNLTIDGYEQGEIIPPTSPIYPSDTLFPSNTSP